MSDFHLFTIQNLILLFIECIVCNTDILETPYVKALGKLDSIYLWLLLVLHCFSKSRTFNLALILTFTVLTNMTNVYVRMYTTDSAFNISAKFVWNNVNIIP